MKIPKDKDGKPKQFAFVNFKHEVSVPYAMNLLNGIKLFGRPIKIQFRSGNSLFSCSTKILKSVLFGERDYLLRWLFVFNFIQF